MVIQTAKTALFSFWSIFIDLDTEEERLFQYFLIEFSIKSSKFAYSVTQEVLFYVFSLNKHVSIDFSGNKPYLFYLC